VLGRDLFVLNDPNSIYRRLIDRGNSHPPDIESPVYGMHSGLPVYEFPEACKSELWNSRFRRPDIKSFMLSQSRLRSTTSLR
jgi:hypothetical protein